MNRWRVVSAGVFAAVVVAGACGDSGDSIEERAAGRWSCTASIADDVTEAVVDIESEGDFDLEIEGETYPGTWERDGDEVEVVLEGAGAWTYSGVSTDTESIDVSEDREPESGRFDVEIDGEDHVVLTQTEWFNGQETGSDDLPPWVFDCTRA